MPQLLLRVEYDIVFGPRDDMEAPGVTLLTRQEVLEHVGKSFVDELLKNVPEESGCVMNGKGALYQVVKPTKAAGGKN